MSQTHVGGSDDFHAMFRRQAPSAVTARALGIDAHGWRRRADCRTASYAALQPEHLHCAENPVASKISDRRALALVHRIRLSRPARRLTGLVFGVSLLDYNFLKRKSI
jgi:hypothetical protein